jgi:hypothetical protein
MIIKLKPELNCVDWVPWFAWLPVITINNELVLFRVVERKTEGISSKTVYRVIKNDN